MHTNVIFLTVGTINIHVHKPSSSEYARAGSQPVWLVSTLQHQGAAAISWLNM